jgi:hypothetical protein
LSFEQRIEIEAMQCIIALACFVHAKISGEEDLNQHRSDVDWRLPDKKLVPSTRTFFFLNVTTVIYYKHPDYHKRIP